MSPFGCDWQLVRESVSVSEQPASPHEKSYIYNEITLTSYFHTRAVKVMVCSPFSFVHIYRLLVRKLLFHYNFGAF